MAETEAEVAKALLMSTGQVQLAVRELEEVVEEVQLGRCFWLALVAQVVVQKKGQSHLGFSVEEVVGVERR